MNSSGVSTAGFAEIQVENDYRFQSQINVSPHRFGANAADRKQSNDNTPAAVTIENTDYDKSMKFVTQNSPSNSNNANNLKPKKKKMMFNKPELTGSVYSKSRKNTHYDREDIDYDE